jgi:hypothetical protein
MLQCLKIVMADRVVVEQVTNDTCRNLFHHFRCTLMQEETDDLLPLQLNDFEENWRCLCDHLFQGDELLDSQCDLGVIIPKLEASPYCDLLSNCQFLQILINLVIASETTTKHLNQSTQENERMYACKCLCMPAIRTT